MFAHSYSLNLTVLFSYKRNIIVSYRFIVDHIHRVAYCFTEKAACSTWKTIMANISTEGKIKSGMTAAQLRAVHYRIGKTFGLEAMRYDNILSHYTKFIVVRHPLDRLVSAYRDKMRGGDVTFYKGAKQVIDTFRKNKTDTSKYPTFREFVQMVLSNMLMSSNPHWNSYFFKCDVCHVNYDYILKVETMEHDMKMFLSNVYLNEMKYVREYKLNSFKTIGELSENSYSKYLKPFEELSTEEIQALMSKYQYEIEMYGYSFNQNTLYADCCDRDASMNNSSLRCCC